jgi:hypothetical protein
VAVAMLNAEGFASVTKTIKTPRMNHCGAENGLSRQSAHFVLE